MYPRYYLADAKKRSRSRDADGSRVHTDFVALRIFLGLGFVAIGF